MVRPSARHGDSLDIRSADALQGGATAFGHTKLRVPLTIKLLTVAGAAAGSHGNLFGGEQDDQLLKTSAPFGMTNLN